MGVVDGPGRRPLPHPPNSNLLSVSVRGLLLLLRFSPCKTPSERWLNLQDLILSLVNFFDCKMFDVAIGLLVSMDKMVPEGCLHMRPFQFHQGALEISSVIGNPPSLVRDHFSSPRANPANVMKGVDLHPKDHSIQLFTDTSNESWGAHL